MRTLFLIAVLGFLSTTGFSQNYLGYSKDYIIKALKSQRKDMKGPIIVKAVNDNYIVYTGKFGKRVVYYHFKPMIITSNTGNERLEEICIKYVSKTKCAKNTDCPEMDEVAKSLDSHFTKLSAFIWVDHTQTVPHEWVMVKDAGYFEVHVTELKE